MTVLVGYATAHGSTRDIARRIGSRLRTAGFEAEVRPLDAVDDVSGYDAFVVGSAVHGQKWLEPARDFVRHDLAAPGSRPVWLFSSGPLGPDTATAGGRYVRAVSVPQDVTELVQVIHPRDHHVFFGALDPDSLRPSEKAVRRLPATQGLMPEGDFRNWAEISAWARSIAKQAKELDPTKR